MNTTQDVQLSLIDIPEAFRQHTMESVDSLAQDIQRNGQLQEIVLTPKEGGRYELVAGKRRTLAMRQLHKDSVRAQVMENLSELQKALIMIAENDEREDVNPFDRALSYQRAIKAGATNQQLAERLGVSEPVVCSALALLGFSAEVTEQFRRQNYSGAKLAEFIRLPDAQSQLKMADACDKQGWSSKVLRDKVSRALAGSAEKAGPAASAGAPEPFEFTRKGKGFLIRSQEAPSMESLDYYMHEMRCAIIDFLAQEGKRLTHQAA